jgi:hypothetical protein
VVTAIYDPDAEGTPLSLASWSVNASGTITAVSMFPPSPLEPLLWTVNPTTGAFTTGQAALSYDTSLFGVGSLGGIPITAGADGGLRLDAWGPGPESLVDLATITVGEISSTPAVAEVSPGFVATAFQNSASDFEIIVWGYN